MPSQLSQLDTTILQVKSLEPETQNYLEEHFEEIIERYVISEIKLLALGMNMPLGFIEGVGFIRIDRNTISIVNYWGTPEKPLARWFNYGTKDHGPVRANALHWIDKITGQHILAKWVRGVPKTLAMERGIEQGLAKLNSNIIGDIKDSVSRKVGL